MANRSAEARIGEFLYDAIPCHHRTVRKHPPRLQDSVPRGDDQWSHESPRQVGPSLCRYLRRSLRWGPIWLGDFPPLRTSATNNVKTIWASPICFWIRLMFAVFDSNFDDSMRLWISSTLIEICRRQESMSFMVIACASFPASFWASSASICINSATRICNVFAALTGHSRCSTMPNTMRPKNTPTKRSRMAVD